MIRLLTAISLLSLLLCFATIGVLVRSYSVADEPTLVEPANTGAQNAAGQFRNNS